VSVQGWQNHRNQCLRPKHHNTPEERDGVRSKMPYHNAKREPTTTNQSEDFKSLMKPHSAFREGFLGRLETPSAHLSAKGFFTKIKVTGYTCSSRGLGRRKCQAKPKSRPNTATKGYTTVEGTKVPAKKKRILNRQKEREMGREHPPVLNQTPLIKDFSLRRS